MKARAFSLMSAALTVQILRNPLHEFLGISYYAPLKGWSINWPVQQNGMLEKKTNGSRLHDLALRLNGTAALITQKVLTNTCFKNSV